MKSQVALLVLELLQSKGVGQMVTREWLRNYVQTNVGRVRSHGLRKSRQGSDITSSDGNYASRMLNRVLRDLRALGAIEKTDLIVRVIDTSQMQEMIEYNKGVIAAKEREER